MKICVYITIDIVICAHEQIKTKKKVETLEEKTTIAQMANWYLNSKVETKVTMAKTSTTNRLSTQIIKKTNG